MRLLDGECRRAVSKYTEMEARNPYLNPLVFQVQFIKHFPHFFHLSASAVDPDPDPGGQKLTKNLEKS
jgi:hypothetical protein